MAITIWVQLSYSPPGRPNKSLKTCKFKVCRFFVFPHSPGDRGLITAADPGNAFRGRTDTTLHYTTLPVSSATGDTSLSAPIDYLSKATSRVPAVSGRILRSWARIRSRDSCGERSGRQASGPKSVSGVVSSDQPQPYSRPWRSRG